ncbi:MAG: acyltransferase [Acidimicrobiia bacterium]
MSETSSRPIGAAPHLAGFDGLRAIAVVAVAVYHFIHLVPVFPTSEGYPFAIGAQLRVGVWVFFVLSGFLLYRPYAMAHAGQRPQPDLARYARARVLRIWPAYAVAVVVLSYVWHKIEVGGASGLVVHLSLTQNYVRSQFTFGLGPAWSLVVEMAFYVSLPLLAWIIGRIAADRDVWRAEIGSLLVLAALGVAWELATVGHKLAATMLPGFIPTFAIGMAFAVGAVHDRDFGLSWLARRPWLCWSGAAGLLVAKGMIGGQDYFEQGFAVHNQIVYSAFAFLVVVPAVFGSHDRPGNRVLRSRPFHLLGLISYGVFLWSIPMTEGAQFDWIGPDFPGRNWVVAIAATAATIAVATASWWLVERPALRLKDWPRHRVRSASGARV